MDKLSKIIINNNVEMILDNIIKIKTFTQEEFVLETTTGLITILGENLDMETLNTDTNKAKIVGKFYKIIFGTQIKNSKKEDNFIKKLLK